MERDTMRDMNERTIRQRIVATWCAKAFGLGHASSVQQRAVRMLEEAIEAYQAVGCDVAMGHALLDHVFSKEPGELAQELGGVGVTVLALANAAQLDADFEERREVARVLSKPVEWFTERNRQKNDAGFDVTGAYPDAIHNAT
jgi:NTP pyrophosphatase (non-canonical NTP hydrolase)